MSLKLAETSAPPPARRARRRGSAASRSPRPLGSPLPAYERLERGRLLPSVSTLCRLAQVLNTSVDVLVGQCAPPPGPRVMREQIATTLGDAARAARERLGLTQAEVAGLMELSPVVYNRLERGRMLPSVPTLVRLCETLRVSPAELLGFPRPEKARKAVAREEDPPSLQQLLTLARQAGRHPAPGAHHHGQGSSPLSRGRGAPRHPRPWPPLTPPARGRPGTPGRCHPPRAPPRRAWRSPRRSAAPRPRPPPSARTRGQRGELGAQLAAAAPRPSRGAERAPAGAPCAEWP